MNRTDRLFMRMILVASIVIAAAGISGLMRAGQQQIPAGPPATGAVVQNNIGVGYMNQFLFKEATPFFQNALAADPSFNLARINLGIAALYNQDIDEAQKALEDALARDEKNPYTNFCLGLLYKNKGESDKAVERFRRVTELDPSDPSSLYNLGVIYSRQRKNQEAESALKRCLELDPLNTSAMYNLGSLLVKTGRTEEGNTILERFRGMQQKGNAASGMGVGSQYGEMGKYALAMSYPFASPGSEVSQKPAGGSAPFVDVTSEAGLSGLETSPAFRKSFPIPFSAQDWNPEYLKNELLPAMGGSVALADLNNDGAIDAVVTRFNAAQHTWQTLILLNSGKGTFVDASTSSGVKNSGSQISAAIGDYDNDALPDIYLVGVNGNALYHNLGSGRFENVTEKAGVAGSGFCVSATFVDYDHDGDLDLYACRYADLSKLPTGNSLTFPDSFPPAKNLMFRNNANGTFTENAAALGVAAGGHHSIGMIPSDVDNDRDIDLVLVNDDAPPQIFANEREDRFTEVTAKSLPGISGALHTLNIADFNRDGAMDFFFAPASAGKNQLWLNGGEGRYKVDARSPELAEALAQGPRFASGFLDYDNDGDLDLYLFGRNGKGTLWENSGDGRFVFAGQLPASDVRGAASADFDGDGRTDVLCLDSSGSPHLLKNSVRNSNHWIGIHVEGLNGEKLGFGAKVEVRAREIFQKFEVQGHNGYLSQDSPVLWVGLGQAEKADTVTVRWPGGVLQSEINVPADRIAEIKELDRKGTSCPLLYTWNGRAYEFVTDFLGGCAIGYLEEPGRYSIPDTDEYVLIEGNKLTPHDGHYLLNLNNQLQEIIMFDRAQLLVVDHPAGTEIHPNERLMPAPPFPEFRLYTARNPRLPRSATDDSGRDILPLIAKKDRIYPTDFKSLPFKGYAESHAITLDLGNIEHAAKIVLLMDAWIDYADSSANRAASQSGLTQIPPYLQVRDRQGKWQTVMPSMGFPAGLPKTMTVDLTGKFITSDSHVRIATNMKIYWDRIRVDTSADEETRVVRLNPESADLHFRGYPVYYTPDGRQPRIYDYSRIRADEAWQTHTGAYTRFGDVRDLLLRRDDEFVITRHGDEISLSFDAARVEPQRQGWVRDYLLYADGYGKDMDMNSLYAEVVGPLPFHAMSRFPYPEMEKYPDDEEHRAYLRKYNTRVYPARELMTRAQR